LAGSAGGYSHLPPGTANTAVYEGDSQSFQGKKYAVEEEGNEKRPFPQTHLGQACLATAKTSEELLSTTSC
jgi:hypothetical protein